MMKKLFVLILALLMTVALVACGKENPDAGTDPDVPEVSTGMDSVSPDLGEDVNDDPTDFAWADSALQNVIPQPPFDGWETLESTDKICKMECATGVTDTTSFYTICENYVQTLNASGFTETEKSKQYLYEATDAAGNTVEFKYGDTYCWITITAGPEA